MRTTCPDQPDVPACIAYNCELNPNALCCALLHKGLWVNYSRIEFWQHVTAYAGLFQRELKEKTLILFSKKLDIHLLSAYIGAMLAGHLPAQISPTSSKLSDAEYRRKIDHIHAITQFGAIFADAEQQPQFANLPNIKFLSLTTSLNPCSTTDFKPAGEALVQFSSGTTGLQKGVILSHKAIIQHMQAYADNLQLNSADAIASWLPLYHDMGLIACYLMPLMCGIPFYQMDPFEWVVQPDLLLAAIEEFKPTLCFLPNFAYHLLAAKGKDHNLSSIRRWINCSEPARAHTHVQFLSRFQSVRPESLTVCYALAEATFAVTQSAPRGSSSTVTAEGSEALSCGAPLVGIELRIYTTGNEKKGEIGVRSATLYQQFLDGTRPLEDGFYKTGDIGYLNKDGELVVIGRKKDLIIVCGKNIFPQDVEYITSQIEGVHPGRVAALGILNTELGSEDLFIFAERLAAQSPTALKIAIQKAVQNEIGVVPKKVEIFEHMSLVKTTSGKVCRSRNRELYLEKSLIPI